MFRDANFATGVDAVAAPSGGGDADGGEGDDGAPMTRKEMRKADKKAAREEKRVFNNAQREAIQEREAQKDAVRATCHRRHVSPLRHVSPPRCIHVARAARRA